MSKRFPLALLSLALLAGCAQKPATPDVDPKAHAQFQQAFQSALQRSISARVIDETAGAVSLRIVVNRQGQALSCKAGAASPDVLERLPAGVPRSEPGAFARLIEKSCLQAIYPTAPDALYDTKGQLEVGAPVYAVFPAADSQRWKMRNAQRAFFREHLLKGAQADSVGLLVIRYQSDAQGCLVDLRSNTMRPADFKLDGGLQSRLNQACMKLDLQQLPGIAAVREKQAVGVVSLDYAPWTTGQQ